ncbi:MAG: hypothetical protein GY822_05535 [Deltaproteobacteria bacterium]|nr:hypothetical protein [Deltaproteobacteria bacterium]
MLAWPVQALMQLAMQIDSNQGTAAAAAGAIARVTAPHPFDAIFPVIAFTLVVIIPTCLVLWVIYKTITEKPEMAVENQP